MIYEIDKEMKTRSSTRLAAFLLLLALSASFFISSTSAEVTELNGPSEILQGREASISGKASPNEAVWLSSSFEFSLPVSVSDGKYACEFAGVHFPAGEKRFSVTAENVKNIRVSLSPVFWHTIEYPLSGPEDATEDGVATLSISFPARMHGTKIDISGRKNVKVYGDAAEGATAVVLKSEMSIKVTADSNGDFLLNLSTEGVPFGEFLISAGEVEKTVSVVSAESLPLPSPSPRLTPSPTPSPTPNPTLPLTPTPAASPAPTPQETSKTFLIPGFGLVEGLAAALIIFILNKRIKY